MATRINIESGDKPHATVKRIVGRYNAGLYCEQCSEFFAVGILPETPAAREVEFVSDGLVTFQCPFCQAVQKRQPSEIGIVLLTEALRRKPSPPKDAH